MFNLEDYETVEERLTKFWATYPDGRIETELIEATANRFVVFTKLFRTEADPKPWTTGLAFESITERGVNSTSALENCETSSIGRALANAGFATKGKRASREEMSKASRERIIKVEKPSDPWTIEPKEMPIPVAEAVTELNDGIVPEQIPTCKHGTMQVKTGNKNGKEWRGYICSTWPPDPNGKCPAVWMEIDKTGRWVPQRPKPEQVELG
jgi:hypothetical protein